MLFSFFDEAPDQLTFTLSPLNDSDWNDYRLLSHFPNFEWSPIRDLMKDKPLTRLQSKVISF